MRAAVRLTARIERRLKKFERELTRPIPKLRGFRQDSRVEREVGRTSFKPAEGWASFKRHFAKNDNSLRVPEVLLDPVKAPPVVLFGGSARSAAPAIHAELRQERRRVRAAPAPEQQPRPVSKRKDTIAPKESIGFKLAAFGVIAFVVSFMIVFTVVLRLV